jgi:threonine aldolase
MVMTIGPDQLSVARRSFSSARLRYFCCRPEQQRTHSRLHTSPLPGQPCCVTLTPTSPPTSAARQSFFGGGLKLVELPGEDGKITAETLKRFLTDRFGHSPHQMIASALSITQATEAGTVYRPNEIATLSEIAHERSLAVHMDGARFANALVRLSATPAQMTWQSGVDVLSFGMTKAGALAAEAVVFFDPQRAAFMAERRKRAGHLLSKHRFLAAQFAAILAGDRWLALARHANLMADKLAGKLAAVGLEPVWPVEANLLFVVLPRALDTKLKAAGARYYRRTNTGLKLGPDQILARLVTSFATQEDEIDRFVHLCKDF